MNAPAAKDPFVDEAGFGCGHGDHARHLLEGDCGVQDGIDLRKRFRSRIRVPSPRDRGTVKSERTRCG